MSTRRARIKAVASLPVRRKQNTNNETKSVEAKDLLCDTSQNDGTRNQSEVQSSSITGRSPRLNKSPQTHKTVSPRDLPKTPRDNLRTPPVTHKNSQAAPKTPYSEINTVKSNEGSSKRKQPTPTRICKVENQLDYKKNNIKDEVINNPSSPEASKTQAAVAVRRRIMRPAINIPLTKRIKLQDNSNRIDKTNPNEQSNEKEQSKSSVFTPPMMQRFSPKTGTPKRQKFIPIDKADTEKLQEVDLTDIDGIVPLRGKSVVEDSDAVKKDIISDVAMVNFDPIIPLHSPSKVRPKLRPAPRLAGRRSSFQGSASESEEDIKKVASTPKSITERRKSASSCPSDHLANKKHVDASKTRTDSQSTAMSPVNQTANTSTQPGRCQSSKPRRGPGILRRPRNPNATKDNLTMYDLIFINPTTNPIIPEKEDVTQTKSEQKQMKLDPGMEEDADDPDPVVPNEKASDGDKEEEPTAMPVPQIKLGPNGEIILDEKSLVIETTESKTRHLSGSIVRETGGWGSNGAGRYTRSVRAKDWSNDETVRFYRALATIGTDFSLMMALFPGRARRDLKVKFKKEERINSHLVDKAMYNPMEFNMTQLMEEFKEEDRRKEEEQRERDRLLQLHKERLLEEKARVKALNKGFPRKIGTSQICINGILPETKNTYTKANQPIRTADEIVQLGLEAKRKVKARHKESLHKRALMKEQGMIPIGHSGHEELKKVQLKNVRIKKQGVQKPNKTVSQESALEKEVPERDTIDRLPGAAAAPMLSATSVIPKNVEMGSLVVLTTEVPGHPTQKMLQTYITGADGKLTPIALPTSLLGSVMNYVRNEDNKVDNMLDLSNVRSVTGGATLTPHVPAPDVASDRATDSVIGNRTRNNSYSITSL